MHMQKNKQIFVWHSVDDPPLMKLVDGTLSIEQTVSLLKKVTESKQEE